MIRELLIAFVRLSSVCPSKSSLARCNSAGILANRFRKENWGAFGHLAALRIRLAAWTMFMRAGRTSSHLRVLRPQSGLTHI
jgi:hypothetical protein